MKEPAENQQVHNQEDASYPCLGGRHCPGSDVIKSIAVLSLAKLALNGNTLTSILFPLCLCLFDRFGSPWYCKSHQQEPSQGSSHIYFYNSPPELQDPGLHSIRPWLFATTLPGQIINQLLGEFSGLIQQPKICRIFDGLIGDSQINDQLALMVAQQVQPV